MRDILVGMLREPISSEGKRLVIVLDGLDEAEKTFEPFPSLPDGVFVIASARATKEGEEPEYLRKWTDNAQPLHLEPLSREAIANWVGQMRELAAYSQDNEFVKSLDKTTGGFPLYLSYLIDDLRQAATKNQDVQAVLRNSPRGFKAYVKEQFRQLAQVEEVKRQREVRELFALLSVALGVLSEDDIQELTSLSAWDLADLPWQATRWFSIQTGSYSFAHPLLAQEFKGVLGRQACSAEDKLIEYCAKWQNKPSSYSLRHYAEHLGKAKRWEELYAIARKEDFASAQQQQLPDEPDLPLKAVQTALLGAAEEDKAEIMAEFVLVHAHRLGQTNAQESPLEALRAGSLGRAWKLADLYGIEHRVLWYLLLAWELKDKGRSKEARETLEKLQQKELPSFSTRYTATNWLSDLAVYFLAYVFEVDEDICSALEQKLLDNYYRRSLCRILTYRELFPSAIKTALKVSSELEQVSELEHIAKVQAKTGDKDVARATFDKALKITKNPTPNLLCLYCLGSIAQAKIEELEDTEAARNIFKNALESVNNIPDHEYQVKAFVDIAKMQTEVGMLSEALDTLQKIEDKPEKENFLRSIGEVLLKAGEKEKARVTFYRAKQVARGIEDINKRFDAFVKIAAVQAKVEEFIEDALKTAEEIDTQRHQAEAFRAIVNAQVKAKHFPAALATARRIGMPMSKAEALSIIAKAQAWAKDFTAALETVAEIDQNQSQRTEALLEIVKAQTWASPFTNDALETAEQIKSQQKQTEALVAIVTAQAEAGDIPVALITKDKIQETNGQQQALSAIAKAYAMTKDYDAALEMVKGVDIPPMRARTFQSIAKKQVRDAKTDEARATFATLLQAEQEPEISISFWKSFALAEVAAIQVKNEQKEEGAATASIVCEIAKSLDDPAEQANILAGIAPSLEKVGKIKEAKAICDSAFDVAQKISKNREDQRSQSFKLVAQSQAKIGDTNAAFKTLKLIQFPLLQAEALKTMVQTTIGADAQQIERFKQLFITAHEIWEDANHLSFFWWDKVELQCTTLAVAQIIVGDKEAGINTLTKFYEMAKVQESRKRDQNLSAIAAAWAKAGEIPIAYKIMNEIENGWEQVKVLCTIAWEQLDQKDTEKLKKTLNDTFKAKNKIKDEQEQMKALRIIAQIQAMTGAGEQAILIAQRIGFNRNRLLSSIASILAETGDRENFKRLLIPCAYYLDATYEMCGYLARLYPKQAAKVAKVVNELTVSST
jgi:tetratricopeptide (TPR) repeat protein